MHADSVNLSCFDNLKATVTVVVIVAETRQGGADTGVDVGIVGEESFFVCMIKVSAMIDRRLLGRCPAEDLWSPGITVMY